MNAFTLYNFVIFIPKHRYQIVNLNGKGKASAGGALSDLLIAGKCGPHLNLGERVIIDPVPIPHRAPAWHHSNDLRACFVMPVKSNILILPANDEINDSQATTLTAWKCCS